ncbi:MAG: hypothetical protein ACXWBN_13320 [Acidimicrobiales bacterium]
MASGDLSRADDRAPRHLELVDLPPAVAQRISFDHAAPRRLRNDDLPIEIQDELRDLWNGIAADIYDEVAGLRRRKAFRRENVEHALRRVSSRLLQAERVVIVTAVHFPVPGEREWRHVAVAGAGGAVAAVAEEAAAIGSLGTATTVAIVAAVVGEVFESYVAASVRTRQYIAAGRSPDPAAIVTDLAEAAGYGESAGRRASARVAHDAASWLGEKLVTRSAVRFSRSLIPVIGVGAGAGISALGVLRVTRLPLRPVSESEVVRLAEDVVADQRRGSYPEARDAFLHLTDGAADADADPDEH